MHIHYGILPVISEATVFTILVCVLWSVKVNQQRFPACGWRFCEKNEMMVSVFSPILTDMSLFIFLA